MKLRMSRRAPRGLRQAFGDARRQFATDVNRIVSRQAAVTNGTLKWVINPNFTEYGGKTVVPHRVEESDYDYENLFNDSEYVNADTNDTLHEKLDRIIYPMKYDMSPEAWEAACKADPNYEDPFLGLAPHLRKEYEAEWSLFDTELTQKRPYLIREAWRLILQPQIEWHKIPRLNKLIREALQGIPADGGDTPVTETEYWGMRADIKFLLKEDMPASLAMLFQPDSVQAQKVIDTAAANLEGDAKQISKADLTILGQIVALENAGGPQVPYRFGRPEGPTPCFPSSEKSAEELRQQFGGFSDREIVLLLGAESLMDGGFSAEYFHNSVKDPKHTIAKDEYFIEWGKTYAKEGARFRKEFTNVVQKLVERPYTKAGLSKYM